MANTWRATSQGVAYASGKSMLDLANESDSARILRAYRLYHFNNGTASVTGVLTTMRVYRSAIGASAPTGGATVTPVAHDTGNSALDAGTTAGTGRTITDGDLFRQYLWSNDEPAVSGSTMDEWELFVPFAEIWNAGYGDSNVQPIVCRAAEGVHIKHQGTSAVGSADFEIEFTDAGT